MRYVDGYGLSVPKQNLQAYFGMAMKASKIWREHGALEYRECEGNDLKAQENVAVFNGIQDAPVQPMMIDSVFACTGCHQQ